MKSFSNEPHYIIFLCPSVIDSLCMSEFLLITFHLTVPHNTLFLQCDSHILHPNRMKALFDFWWMKHSTASGTSHAVSHKIKIYFLKSRQNPIPSQILFSQGYTAIGAGNSVPAKVAQLATHLPDTYINWRDITMVKGAFHTFLSGA